MRLPVHPSFLSHRAPPTNRPVDSKAKRFAASSRNSSKDNRMRWWWCSRRTAIPPTIPLRSYRTIREITYITPATDVLWLFVWGARKVGLNIQSQSLVWVDRFEFVQGYAPASRTCGPSNPPKLSVESSYHAANEVPATSMILRDGRPEATPAGRSPCSHTIVYINEAHSGPPACSCVYSVGCRHRGSCSTEDQVLAGGVDSA